MWELYEIGSVGVPVSRPLKSAPDAATSTRAATASRTSPCSTCATGSDGADRALVDVNGERADGTRALDWWFPSDDGALVAYGVSDDGSEESTLRVRDVATGKELADEIARARPCSLAWTPDGRGFYYTRYPAPGEVPADETKYHRSVFHHRLGDDPAKDRKLFGDGRDKTDWPGVDLSPDGRWLAITVSQGWSKSEVYVVDVRAGRQAGRRRRRRETRSSASSSVLDDRLFVVHDQRRAARAGLRRRPGAAGARALARDRQAVGRGAASGRVLPRRPRDRVACRTRRCACGCISADGAPRGDIPLPGLGALTALTGARDIARDLLRVHIVPRRDRGVPRRRGRPGRAGLGVVAEAADADRRPPTTRSNA